MRILNFVDGFESNSEPNLGVISTNSLYKFANDADFVAYKGAPATASDIYFNQTLGIPRVFNGAHWVSIQALDENGNFIVPGDLTVNGTMTVINTENLEVKDKNITLNKGGNDLTSQDAGFTVEREGLDGSLVYDSAASSKWKVGNKGAESEVVTISDTQSLSNKTLVSPEITSPTGIVKADVGLSNVNNTSDVDKPLSTAQAEAILTVQTSLADHVGEIDNPHEVTKAQVGLSNVDNTSDTEKPVSTAQAAALYTKVTIADGAVLGGEIDFSKSSQSISISDDQEFTFAGAINGKSVSVSIKNTSAAEVNLIFPTLIKRDDFDPKVKAGKTNVYTFLQIDGLVYGAVIPEMA